MAVSHTMETTTTYTDLLKYVYAPAIVQATAEKSFLFSHLETVAGKLGYGGKSFVIPLNFDNMGSVASLDGESDDLPDSLPGSDTTSTVSIYQHYFAVAVSGLAMETSNKDEYAFAEAWANQIRVKSRSFRQHMNRQYNGDGNAYLCQVDGSPSESNSDYTITLDNAFGLSGYKSSNINGAKFITTNMKVDFVSSSTVRDAGGVLVSTVTPGAAPSTSAYITCVNGDCNEVEDGDYVTVKNSYGHEQPGMAMLIDDGTRAATFQGVTVASYPEFEAHVHYGSTPGTAEPATCVRLQSLIDDVEVAGGNIDWSYTSNAVWLTLGEIFRQERQLVTYDTIKTPLDIGWKAIMFDGYPIYKDPYSIDELYFIDNRCIKIHEAGPQGWLEYDGNVVKQVSGKDQWQAWWRWYSTPAMHNRQWCGKLTDISVNDYKV